MGLELELFLSYLLVQDTTKWGFWGQTAEQFIVRFSISVQESKIIQSSCQTEVNEQFLDIRYLLGPTKHAEIFRALQLALWENH